ncbi:MAG: membrane dipeptidase [Anaerolineales bacterium]|nr:membrane dipeptidase [Anaerolineales bacterium]
MHLIVDSHQDLAWNMLTFKRDYTRPLAETRRLEANTLIPERNGDSLLGWDEYQRGSVAVVFSTLFAAPARKKELWDSLWYPDFDTARKLYRDQLTLYRKWTDSHHDKFRIVSSTGELDAIIQHWSQPQPDGAGHPVGMVMLMEGAEGIRSVKELPEWWDMGLRIIGLAWMGTRYCGGTNDPGPLTDAGRELIAAMAEMNFILDISHMDEASALESLDRYEGALMASHSNCAALMKGSESNRHVSDRVIEKLIERGGVIGSVPFNTFLKVGWSRKSNSRREEVSMDAYVAHIDHVCQLAGDSLHAAIGTDFDGGFGLQSVPLGFESVADLQLVADKLKVRGYSETDAENILGGNWLRLLRKNLPA